jgi:hypothetical protein
MPEAASSQVNVTVTAPSFQPSAFAGGLCVWPIVGEVRSMPKPTVCGVSALPAASTLQTSSVWSPSPATDTLVPAVGSPPSSR